MHQKILILFLVAMALSPSCGMNTTNENSVSTPGFMTATLPGISTPTSAATQAPTAPLPALPPIEGTTTTQINVRSEPSTIGNSLGTIAPFSKVQILGRESYGAWYQIIYLNSTDGKGWVTRLYVQVDAAAEIPVIQTEADLGVSGLVIQPINIRSGPGTVFDSLGSLSPNDVVTVTGKDSSGEWMQIKLKAGVGWVASEFLKVNGTDALPITAGTTQIIPTGESTGSGTLVPPQLTYLQDNDSMRSPSISVQLSSLGTGAVQFNGNVSSPDGDTEDWLQFTSDHPDILIGVKCSTLGLHVELWKDIDPVGESILSCEETEIFGIESGQTYSLRVVVNESAILRVTPYILILELVR